MHKNLANCEVFVVIFCFSAVFFVIINRTEKIISQGIIFIYKKVNNIVP